MKKALYKTLYFLAYGFWYLVALLPFPVLYLLSDGLYFVMAKVIKYRHKVIWKNLKNSFPEKTDDELRQIEQGFHRWFCDYIVETLKLMTMSKKQLIKRMTFTGTEELNRVLSEGKSAAIYLGHLGNWEWITSTVFSSLYASVRVHFVFLCKSLCVRLSSLVAVVSRSLWALSQTNHPSGGAFITGFSL